MDKDKSGTGGHSGCTALQEEEKHSDAEERQHTNNAQRLIGDCRSRDKLNQQREADSSSNPDEQLNELHQRRGGSQHSIVHADAHSLVDPRLNLACVCAGDSDDACGQPAQSTCLERSLPSRPIPVAHLHSPIQGGGGCREDDGYDKHDGDQLVIGETGSPGREAQFACDCIADGEGQIGAEGRESVGRTHAISRETLALVTQQWRGMTLEALGRLVLPRCLISAALGVILDGGPTRSSSDAPKRATGSTRKVVNVTGRSVFGIRASDLMKVLSAMRCCESRAADVLNREMVELEALHATCSVAAHRNCLERVRMPSMQRKMAAETWDILPPGAASSSTTRTQRRGHRLAWLGVGAAAAVILLFATLAEEVSVPTTDRAWTLDNSEASRGVFPATLREVHHAVAEWIQSAGDEIRRSDLRLAMTERAALGRAAEAVEHATLEGVTQRLSPADRLRCQVAAARQAAWPLAASEDLPTFHASAVLEGVAAGIRMAQEPMVPLASMRTFGWYAYGPMGQAAPGSSYGYPNSRFVPMRRRGLVVDDASSQSGSSVSRTRSLESSYASSAGGTESVAGESLTYPLQQMHVIDGPFVKRQARDRGGTSPEPLYS